MESPFEAIPGHAADVLRPHLPGLADEIIAQIAREVPDYQRAMEGVFGQMVRLGVEVALGRFVDDIEGLPRAAGPERDTYVNLGRGEFHSGRSLDNLLAAYRVGARLAWRRFVQAGVGGGLEPPAIYSIGESIFEYIDVLSAESAEGYALEQRAEAGERRRRRRRLVALLADPAAPEQEMRAAATDAGWRAPRELGALMVAVEGDDVSDAAERLARVLGHGVVAAALDGVACAIVPDPGGPGARRRIEAAVEGAPAALGSTVAWRLAHRSVQRARAALALAPAGDGGLVVADEHLPELLLAADRELAGDLAHSRLAPLRDLPPAVAQRLRETLAAWLDRPGQVQAVAAQLGVHPQTVRYRVRRLRELFGEALEQPDGRFELMLALRAAATAPG